MVSKDAKRWNIVANVVMSLLSALALLPFLLLIIASFTDEDVALKYGYSFFPKKLALDAYQYILENSSVFFKAYGMTILVTFIGTVSCIVLTALTAYVLSKRNLPGVKIMNMIVVITMLFNG